MSRSARIHLGAMLWLLLSPAVALADGVSIDHQGVGCVVAGKFPRFDARLDPADAVARVRLHFRPEGGPHWYFVDMKPEAGVFSGILPKPQKTLRRFSYYIDVVDRSFNDTRTAEFALEVAAGPAACGKGKVLATSLPKANVLVHAPEGVAGAPTLPAGFAVDGVVAAGAAGVAAAAGAGGGGLGSTALILGGVAVAGGTAAVIATTSKGDGGSSPQTPAMSSAAVGTYALEQVNGSPLPVVVVDTPCIGFADSGRLVLGNDPPVYEMTETTRFQCLSGPGPVNPHSESGRWSETGNSIGFTANGVSVFNLSNGTLTGATLTLSMDMLSEAVGVPPRRVTTTWRKQ